MKVPPNSKPGLGAAACIAVLAAGIVVAACDPASGSAIVQRELRDPAATAAGAAAYFGDEYAAAQAALRSRPVDAVAPTF